MASAEWLEVEFPAEMLFHDGHDINNFNFDSVFRIDRPHSIDVRAGVLDGVNEEDLEKSGKLGAITNPDIIMDDSMVKSYLREYELMIRDFNAQSLSDRDKAYLKANPARNPDRVAAEGIRW